MFLKNTDIFNLQYCMWKTVRGGEGGILFLVLRSKGDMGH